jgi:DNA-binding response OmpR family regulator
MHSGKKILIVDDDISTQQVLKLILNDAGYKVRTENNANNLLQPFNEYPDIILLDNNLPETPGYVICSYLKKQKSTQEIPIILISAMDDLEEIAHIAGADDYILKPFGIHQLLQKVEETIYKTELLSKH